MQQSACEGNTIAATVETNAVSEMRVANQVNMVYRYLKDDYF